MSYAVAVTFKLIFDNFSMTYYQLVKQNQTETMLFMH